MGMNTRYVKEYFYKKKIRSTFVWILEIIAAILLAAAFSWFFCRSSPKRGDIIAFRTSEDKKASIHIKRVIALPGETVQIKDGQILINGEVYNEKDEFPAITNAGLASEPITVGKGQYFVLGDNRNNSEDSRHNGMGLVDSDRIVGKLWFTISPWKKIGFV